MRHLALLLVLIGCTSSSSSSQHNPGNGEDGGGPDGGQDLAQPGQMGYDLAAPDLAHPPGDLGSSSKYLFPATWTILLENHSRDEILSSPDATHLKMLASTYAQAAMFQSPLHPSLPNYIEMSCGCNSAHSSVTVNDPSAKTVFNGGGLFGDENLGDQLETAGVPWRAYAQDSSPTSKLTNCYLGNTGEYASRHVPFLYFSDFVGPTVSGSATCKNRVRVFGDFQNQTGDFFTDLNAGTYAYQWITPDLIYDMHDGTIADGDQFIGAVVPAIQKTDAYKAGGVIFINFDEGENGSDQILFIAVSNRAKMGYSSPTVYTQDNFLATIEDIYGLPRTGAASGKQNMLELFQ